MTPADVVLSILYDVVSWASDRLPRLPSSWISFVDGIVSDAHDLLAGVPYSNLVPWSTVNAVVGGLPVVLLSAFALRTILRVFAWVRSRGAADQ